MHLHKTLLVALDEPKTNLEEILGETTRKTPSYGGTPKPVIPQQPPPPGEIQPVKRENRSSEFLTRFDTNLPVLTQEKARSLKSQV